MGASITKDSSGYYIENGNPFSWNCFYDKDGRKVRNLSDIGQGNGNNHHILYDKIGNLKCRGYSHDKCPHSCAELNEVSGDRSFVEGFENIKRINIYHVIILLIGVLLLYKYNGNKTLSILIFVIIVVYLYKKMYV